MPLSQKEDPVRRVLEHYPFRFETRMLFADVDALRHVNNGATGRFFEEGRAELQARIFGRRMMIGQEGGMLVMLARIAIDYVRQAQYPGSVAVGSGVSRIGSSSFHLVQGAFQSGACYALADSVLVKAIDGRPSPLTESERHALQEAMISQA